MLRYTLALPEGFDPARPYPLVLSLHHAGHVAPFFGKGMLTRLILPALQGLDAIFVAPDLPAPGWDLPESEAAVLDLLAHVKRTYKIDDRKTLVTGYSLGGRGTWFFAARHASLFRAAIPMAGYMPDDEPKKMKDPPPLYVIHARQDQVAPFKPTEKAFQQLKKKGYSIELVVLEEIGHRDSEKFVAPLLAAVPWIERAWGK